MNPSSAADRAMLDAMPQLMVLGDRDGAQHYVNRRWYEHTGLPNGSVAEAIWLTAIHPEDRPAIEAAWAQSRPKAEAFELRFRCRRHDGVWRRFTARVAPLFDRAGTHTSWLGKVSEVDDATRGEPVHVESPHVSSMVGVITDALAHTPSLSAALAAGVNGMLVHLGATSAQV